MARPLSPTNHRFGLGITGQNFDPTNLAKPEQAVAFFHRETGRNELDFGEFTWLSHFRYGLLFFMLRWLTKLDLICEWSTSSKKDAPSSLEACIYFLTTAFTFNAGTRFGPRTQSDRRPGHQLQSPGCGERTPLLCVQLLTSLRPTSLGSLL
jgi:hypothetical protein